MAHTAATILVLLWVVIGQAADWWAHQLGDSSVPRLHSLGVVADAPLALLVTAVGVWLIAHRQSLTALLAALALVLAFAGYAAAWTVHSANRVHSGHVVGPTLWSPVPVTAFPVRLSPSALPRFDGLRADANHRWRNVGIHGGRVDLYDVDAKIGVNLPVEYIELCCGAP